MENIIDSIKIIVLYLGLSFLSIIALTSWDIFEEWNDIVRMLFAIVGIVSLFKWASRWVEAK